MTTTGPLPPPPCRHCGGAGEVTRYRGAQPCPRCHGSKVEPPVPAAELEAQGQMVMFSVAPYFVGWVSGNALLALLLVLFIVLVEAYARRQKRREAELQASMQEASERQWKDEIAEFRRRRYATCCPRERASWR